MILFRKATLNDLDAIESIYNRIHSEEEKGNVTIGWNRFIYPTRETAKEAICLDDMFVEVDDGMIVASARINQRQMDVYYEANWKYKVNDSKVMVLHTLTVDPLQERKGYAKAFVDFYESYSFDHGCLHLRIDTNEKNTKARNLYSKLGYDEVSILPCVFEGLPDVNLVCLEKKIESIDVIVTSAFCKEGQGGNRAGVVLNCPNLSDVQKMKISKELGYSETAFVQKSDVADFKIDYFTPTEEVNLCGHATIATFSTMFHLNQLDKEHYTFETKAGVLNCWIEKDGLVRMEQNCPEYSSILEKYEFNSSLQVNSISNSYPIQIVSTGLRDILLPIQTIEDLEKLDPNFDEMAKLSQEKEVIGVHAYCLEPKEYTAICRNFAPLYGIDEESATGTSNCALACLLFKYGMKQPQYIFEQGYSLHLPSRIVVNLDYEQDTIQSVTVGGYGVIEEKMMIQIN